MEKKFEEAVIEVIRLTQEDVIATSGCTGGTGTVIPDEDCLVEA